MRQAHDQLRRQLFADVIRPHGFDLARKVAARSVGSIRQEIRCDPVLVLDDRYTPRWDLRVFGDDTNYRFERGMEIIARNELEYAFLAPYGPDELAAAVALHRSLLTEWLLPLADRLLDFDVALRYDYPHRALEQDRAALYECTTTPPRPYP